MPLPHFIYTVEGMRHVNARQSTNTSVLSDEITAVAQAFLPAYVCSGSLVSTSSCVDLSSSHSTEPSDKIS